MGRYGTADGGAWSERGRVRPTTDPNILRLYDGARNEIKRDLGGKAWEMLAGDIRTGLIARKLFAQIGGQDDSIAPETIGKIARGFADLLCEEVDVRVR